MLKNTVFNGMLTNSIFFGAILIYLCCFGLGKDLASDYVFALESTQISWLRDNEFKTKVFFPLIGPRMNGLFCIETIHAW